MNNINEWVDYIINSYPENIEIDLDLKRINSIKNKLNLKVEVPIITVGGTNGKGSTCTFLSYIYAETGFKVGTFTSPHLFRINERFCINNNPVSDEDIIFAFQKIKDIKGEINLTFFEYNTLAAIIIFLKYEVDIIILEVGLGGRLDAVNIFDSDVAIVTNIGLDHQDYLGDTLDKIAIEKAGIFRANKPAIIGDNKVPEVLKKYAEKIGSKVLIFNRDFHFDKFSLTQWIYKFHPQKYDYEEHNIYAISMPSLLGDFQLYNASSALTAIECLKHKMPVDSSSIKRAIIKVVNKGRFHVLPGKPMVVLDVAHNVHAAKELRHNMIKLPLAKKRVAVFSVLKDKDLDGIINEVKDQFDIWCIAPINNKRGLDLNIIKKSLLKNNIKNIYCFNTIKESFKYALSLVEEMDRIIVFGSFYVVSEVLYDL